MARPQIGVTRSGSAGRITSSYQSYHDRIREAGAELVDLYPSIGQPVMELIDELDGLLISGGPDVLPERYGAERAPETDQGDPPRDELELGLLHEALARHMPVLAICRGQQVLNVALGGGLLQHIEGDGHRSFQNDAGEWESRWHDVTIEPDSKLGALVGAGRVHTNARHHQAVPEDALGAGLVVTARSDDGIVEALEAPAHRWVVAVQWHPEREEVASRFRPLFQAFVGAAAATGAAVARR